MKRLAWLILVVGMPLMAQFSPPSLAGYQWNGSLWTPLTTTSTAAAINFTPPAAGLYCYNSTTGLWVPADSTCLGGGGGGTGTVTTFSAGTLSPLFTTSVATATTTPALTFSLSNAAANTVFGNFTGSSAAPTFSATPAFAITNLTGTCTACTANAATTAVNLSGGGTATATPALSTAAVLGSVAVFTGGSGTTTFPYWMIQPSGASAATTWSTTGTLLGLNAPSSYTGNLVDLHVNGGASLFRVASTGSVLLNGYIFMGNTKFTATGCTAITATAGAGTAGKFTIGAATCTVVITMNGATGLAAPTGWSCHANDVTTAAGNTGLYFSANSTTTATLTVPATAVASDVIDFGCQAY